MTDTHSALLAAACREYLTAYDGARTSAAFGLSAHAQREATARLDNAHHYLTVLLAKLGGREHATAA